MSSYIPIASQTLGSSASSVTFSSIPTTLNGKTLRDLVLVVQAQTTSAGVTARMTFNGGSAGSYVTLGMEGNGSSTTSGTWATAGIAMFVVNGYLTSGENGTGIFQIMDYAQTNKHKSVLVRAGRAGGGVVANAGRWDQTTAITSLTIGPFGSSWASGARFDLYGIEG